MVDLGILVARDGAGPFLETDCRRCAWPPPASRRGCRWRGSPRPSGRAAVVSVSGGRPLPAVGGAFGADLPAGEPGDRDTAGAARQRPGVHPLCQDAPDEPIPEDELEIVPLLQLGLSTGILDQVWSTRLGRGSEGLRLMARVETEIWQTRFIAHLLEAGDDQQPPRAGRPDGRRLQLHPPGRPRADGRLPPAAELRGPSSWWRTSRRRWNRPASSAGPAGAGDVLLDLVGYTRLTEEHGDQAAAALAETLSVLVERSSREHGGVPVKWLGDG